MSDGAPNLHVQADRDGDRLTIAVAGEIDTATSPEVERFVRESLDGDVKLVELDLAGVEFIDSSGLRALVVAQQTVSNAGGVLRVVRPSSQVERLFELTGLGDTLLGV
jgi:anti-anti-sigma factor